MHARRLTAVKPGHRRCRMFTVRPDGTFTDPCSAHPQARRSSTPRRAGRPSTSGKCRPAIIGTEPIPVILHVKYQYGLR
ncbi:MAG: hypothetical protein ACLSTO_11165 [Bilophila wadsworthia]